MDIINTQVVDNAEKHIEEEKKRFINRFMSFLNQQVRQEIPKMVLTIKNIMMYKYKVLTLSVFQKVFNERYKGNYDINSLNNCLSFGVKDFFYPYVSYDPSKLSFKADLYKSRQDFNQNVKYEGSFKNFIQYDEFDAAEELDLMGFKDGDEDPYNYAMDMDDGLVSNRSSDSGAIIEPSVVFKEAQMIATQEFANEYNNVIKPTFESEYGVDINYNM